MLWLVITKVLCAVAWCELLLLVIVVVADRADPSLRTRVGTDSLVSVVSCDGSVRLARFSTQPRPPTIPVIPHRSGGQPLALVSASAAAPAVVCRRLFPVVVSVAMLALFLLLVVVLRVVLLPIMINTSGWIDAEREVSPRLDVREDSSPFPEAVPLGGVCGGADESRTAFERADERVSR